MSRANIGERHGLTTPRYRRGGPSFDELFGAAAHDVLTSMDEAGDDVPGMVPAHAIAIDGVSLCRRGLVIAVDDPFGSDVAIPAVCSVRVSAGVPPSRRGVHVSRIGQVIADSVGTSYPDVSSYAEAIARAVAVRQYGRAHVQVQARIPFLEDVQADRSGQRKQSLEHLHVIAGQAIQEDQATQHLGLQVTHLLACPCVQQTGRHASRLGAPGTPAPQLPLITHSQRAITRVIVRGVTRRISVARMLAALDEVLFRTCNTLPRDAELIAVYRAHRTPQFIEDALRAAVAATAALWSWPRGFRAISGRSRSLESIHGHDLTASLTLRAADQSARA